MTAGITRALRAGGVVVAVVTVAFASAAPARGADTGTLTALPGADGCLSGGHRTDCTRVRGWNAEAAPAPVVSPDGRFVYVATGRGVFSFRRRPDDALRQLQGRAGCLTAAPHRGCARMSGRRTLREVRVVITPDGRTLYLLTYTKTWAVLSFSRDLATGRLTPLPGRRGCLTAGRHSGCLTLPLPPQYAYWVAVSPDGGSLLVSMWHRVVVFARDAASGALRLETGPGQCITVDGRLGCAAARSGFHPLQVTFSHDGRFVYTASNDGLAVETFAYDPATRVLGAITGPEGCVRDRSAVPDAGRVDQLDACTNAPGADGSWSVELSADDRNVYATGDAALWIFRRDPATGELDFLASVTGLAPGVATPVLAPDGQSLYLGNAPFVGDAFVSVFRRVSRVR